MDNEEAAVTSHQTFQDLYNKCCAWIRTVGDKLASCSEGQSDKEKLQCNISQIKVCSEFYGNANVRISCSSVFVRYYSKSCKLTSAKLKFVQNFMEMPVFEFYVHLFSYDIILY